jgi:hypothetical protein
MAPAALVLMLKAHAARRVSPTVLGPLQVEDAIPSVTKEEGRKREAQLRSKTGQRFETKDCDLLPNVFGGVLAERERTS